MINIYHSLDSFSRRQIDDIFLIFPRKQDFTFHANCLLRRQFAWNVKSCFLGKIRKIFQNVVCWKFYPECWALKFNIWAAVKNIPLTCAPTKDSAQPVHLRSLIRIFTGRILDNQGCKVSSCGKRSLIKVRVYADWFESLLAAHVRRYVLLTLRPQCYLVGGGGGGGNLGVILVRVCEPVFQNLPHSYTWPSKKRTHSYTWSSKMLTYSYTALRFLYPFLLVITQLSQSIHVIPRG